MLDPDQFPSGVTHQVGVANLLIKPGALVHRLQFGVGMCQFGEADSDGGYVLSLEATLPTSHPELMAWQYKYSQCRWVALIRQIDEQCWLLGNPETGLRYTFNRSIATGQSSKLTFSGRDWHPAWALPTIDLATLFPDAGFDYSFNLSFDS
ncbi:hypothetical protein [Spirosoma oryzicola]|uniref:hypothetical protein n=1 Tax=Spirosoma oryzicola TaxID=2898794 RepID=UPI001E5F6285|nr:hypothetical protein [Spirosoma oryzicola]UHG93327.1 hypothetical protein LQ777_10585 [Spirosoma oryzicola]